MTRIEIRGCIFTWCWYQQHAEVPGSGCFRSAGLMLYSLCSFEGEDKEHIVLHNCFVRYYVREVEWLL